MHITAAIHGYSFKSIDEGSTLAIKSSDKHI
jgi:hypothetical protein